MAYTTARIINCKKASVRCTPWIPLRDTDIVGIRDGPIISNSVRNTVKNGDIVQIDLKRTCYDWTGRKFYKIRIPDGWIYEGVLDIGDDSGE